MIVYIENPIDSTKKLLNLLNEFGKTAGYKVNIQKSKAFFYINNEISETEIRKKKSHLIYQQQQQKIPRNKPNQGDKRPVLRKLHNTEERNSGRQTNGSMHHAHGLEELTSSKWPYYPK